MNFGVISTAAIGRRSVIPAIGKTDATVLAIASRDADRARRVAEEFGIPRSYGSYADLLDDPDLDAVYNPLPNALHAEWTERAADAGLDVLCEKPLASDAGEAREMVEHCEDRGVLLMEAFMYRYHPRTERAIELVREELGTVRTVKAGFHFDLAPGYDVRVDPDLAGGSLMDAGCYPVSAIRQFCGEPERAYATAVDRRDCGVDTQLTGLFEFDGGTTATLSTGFDGSIQFYAVYADDGYVRVEESFVPRGETRLEYAVDGRRGEETFDAVDQYRLEVEQFLDCVASGDSPRTDGAEAVANMDAIDALYESAERGAPVTVG